MSDVPLLDAWESSPEEKGEFNDFGLTPHSFERAAVEDSFVTTNRGLVLVLRLADGAPIGTISWREALYGPPETSRAWQLGIALLPDARGQGYGSEALATLARHLFATTTANRIEGQTDVDNASGKRALEKAGFTAEGVARGSQFRAGRYHDLVVYSLLRDEVAD